MSKLMSDYKLIFQFKHCKENEYCELEGCYGRHHCPNGRAVCKRKVLSLKLLPIFFRPQLLSRYYIIKDQT